jgi:DNA-binding protein YbaB
MRHVKLRPGKEPDVEALSDLIVAAYNDIRQRLRE